MATENAQEQVQETNQEVKYQPMQPLQSTEQTENQFDPEIAPYRLDLVKKGIFNKQREVSELQSFYNYRQQARENESSLGGLAKKLTTSNTLTNLSDSHVRVGSTLLPRFKNFLPGSDNNERLALSQSAGNKVANGLGKMFATAGTTFAGMTVGTVTAIGNWMFNGMSIEALRTDSFNMWLDDINERLNYTLPNYYTEEEMNRSMLGTVASVNFWANDVANGIGFLGGAILGNMVTGGLAFEGTVARLGLQLGARGGATAAAKQALRGSAKSLTAKELVSTTKELGLKGLRLSTKELTYARRGQKVGALLDQTKFFFTNAAYQGSIESRHAINEAREQFFAYHQAMGTGPTKEEIARFEKDAIKAGNWIYGLNLPLVGMTNMAILGKMFKIPSPIPKTLNTSFQRTFMGVGTKMEKGVRVAIKPNKAQNIFGHTYSLGRGAAYLGLGELPMQRVFRESGKNWLESGYDADSIMEAYDIGGSVGEAFADAYGSSEGWREMASGLVIGFIGGAVGGQFRTYSNAKKNVQSYVENANKELYSAQVARDRVFMYSQIVNATKAEAEAEANGEFSAAKRARESAMLSAMEFHEQHGMGETFAEDFYTVVDAAENSKVSEEYGIPLDEVTNFKNQVKEEFRDLQSRYQSNRSLAQALLGRGEANSDLGEKYKIVPYIAYNFTMGENAAKVSSDILDSLISQIHNKTNIASEGDLNNAVKLKKALDRASSETRVEYENAKRETERVKEEANKLIAKIRDRQAIYERMEDSAEKQAISSELQNLADELNRLQEQEVEAQAKQEAVVKTMELENPFKSAEATSSPLTFEAIEAAERTILEIDHYLKQMANYDPKTHRTFTDLMDEYMKSMYAFVEYKKTVQGLISPNFDPGNYITKLSKSMNNKLSNEYTKNYFQTVGEQYLRTQQDYISDKSREFVNTTEEGVVETPTKTLDELVADKSNFETENNEGDRAKIEQIVEDESRGIERNSKEDNLLKTTYSNIYESYTRAANERTETEKAKTYLDNLQNITKKALDRSKNISFFIGEDISRADAKRPTQQEIDEYKELHEKNQNLTEVERERYNELANKLSDWQVQDGLMIDGFEGTFADLIERISQLTRQVYGEQTVKEITNEHAIKIEEAGDKNSSSTIDNQSMLQDAESDARVKFDKSGNVLISHVKPIAFINHFGEAVTEVTIKTEEGEVALEPSQFNQIENFDYQGATFTFKFGDQAVEFEIGDRSRIVLSPENADKVMENTNLVFMSSNVDPQSRSNSWLIMYERNADDSITSVKSTFDNPTDREAPIQKMTASEKANLQGKKLQLRVDPHNHYNKMLVEKVRVAKENLDKGKEDNLSKEELKKLGENYQEALTFLENNIVIEAMSGNKTAGQIRAKHKNNDTESGNKFSQARQKAAQALLSRLELPERARDSQLLVEVGAEVPVGFTYSGSPVFLLETADGQTQLAPRDITVEDLRIIKDAGYAVGNEVTVGKVNPEEVDTTYLDKTDNRTIPIAVLEFGGKLIAFPLTLKGMQVNLAEQANTILENFSNEPAKTINRLNNLLLENGLDPKQFELRESDVLNATENLNNLYEALEAQSVYTDVTKWAEPNFDLNNLTEQAQTVVDLTNNPFSTPKSRLTFSEVEFTNVKDQAEAMAIESDRIETVGEIFNDLWNLIEVPLDYAPNNSLTKFIDTYSGATNPSTTQGYLGMVGYINNIGAKIMTIGGKGGKAYQEAYGENFFTNLKSKIKDAANKGYLPTLAKKINDLQSLTETVNEEIKKTINENNC